MMDDRTSQAAFNNAVWCDTVCRSHGSPGEFWDTLWMNRQETPRFYPNVVTLAEGKAATAQRACLRELIAANLPGEWAVKDSFCALDLSPLGFQALFEAEWIYRAPAVSSPEGALSGVEWRRLNSALELARWEAAWNASADSDPEPDLPRIFLPALLEQEEIAILAAYREKRITAGAIANSSGAVVGVSNLFVPPKESAKFRAGAIAAIMEAFPGRASVGYESGPDLAQSLALGFEAVGPLRIWVRSIR